MLPRQHYKTQTAVIIYAYLYLYGTTNSKFIFTNKELTYAHDNLTRLKDIIKLLPSYLVPDESKEDVDNLGEMSCSAVGNSIKSIGPANNVKGAVNKGRGATTSMQWLTLYSIAT